MEDSVDGQSVRTSAEQMLRDHRQDDLESAWVEDLGATWKVKDPLDER